MNIADAFRAFWSSLVNHNQKIKFRNSRESREFIRHLARTSKPNSEVLKMRERYVAIRAEREAARTAESIEI